MLIRSIRIATPLALVIAALGCAGTAVGGDDSGRADGSRDSARDGAVTDDVPDASDTYEPFDGFERTDGSDDIVDMDTAIEDVVTPMDVVIPTDTGPARDVVTDTAPPMDPRGLLLNNGRTPLPCADPAVISEQNRNQHYYVYCTSMSHVWSTTDWYHFTDERSSTTFNMGSLSANGQHIGSWWAPGIAYAPGMAKYFMWVSVPAARATDGADGWTARSLAVFSASSPTGPWRYERTAIEAGANEHYIDPFIFQDHDGARYVFWKQYGGAVSSSIMGQRVDTTWAAVTGSRVEIMNGYGGAGTWEDNVRENPAIWYNPATNRHQFLFSGGHWRDDTYATGHAISTCGPLCVGTGGWAMRGSGDRNIFQVVRSNGLAAFANGGPGGAVFQDDDARYIIYAANARSQQAGSTRYLMRSRVSWANGAPFVDNGGHHPEGF